MKTAALVFPHQLYSDSPIAADADTIFIIEDDLYFTHFKYHKKKLVLHRASMKYYQAYLSQNGHSTQYIDNTDFKSTEDFIKTLKSDGYEKIKWIDTTDYLLERRLKRAATKHSVESEISTTPGFFTELSLLEKLMKKGSGKGYFMATFYKEQRRRLDILMDDDEPKGGKWSFDEENRKKLPKNHAAPEIYKPQQNEYLQEAINYVNHNFKDNYGSTENFNYPITFYQAKKSFDDFLENRMHLFGDYEDAFHKDKHFIYHSVLTPSLNIGLLTPAYVIERTLELHEKKNFPLNCLEGFIRQIIGWREFMRGIYELEGNFERKNNHWQYSRKIPESFWSGETGIDPIDDTIKKVIKTGYNHHIERLMVMGNFMLLCEFDPDEIYKWFMEMYVDAYDWVMVPNVYGMTQYADGGLITTKPYVSSSNYIRKMSNYGKGDWCDIWDGLYWRFMKVHEEEFSKNQRMSMMVSLLNRMDKQKLQKHIDTAEEFLDSL